MPRWMKYISFFVFFFGIAGAGASYYFWNWLNTPLIINNKHAVLLIKRGDTLHKVSRKMQNNGLIAWPKVWVSYARFKKLSQIRTGEFKLNERESPLSILAILNSKDVVQYQLTIVEGIRVSDAISIIQTHPKIKKTMNDERPLELVSNEGVTIINPEGWLYPDTYQFTAGDTDMQLVQRMYKKMQAVLVDEWQNRSDNLPYKDRYEALIMASIIEKETGAAHERNEIAGVFVRRMQKSMRLQTDPTVIYGLGEDYDGNITRSDLRLPTPYNTYVIKGLPPTPIALPGREAIRAALHPKVGSALFFVARGDGTHAFSDTLEQHLQAVKAFQLNRKENYRSQYRPDQDDSTEKK